MSTTDIEVQIKKITEKHLDRPAGTVLKTDDFINDLGADSLDNVELIMAFEEEFDVEISDEAAEHINTVGDAIDLLTKLVA